jgi:hypothetical protein
MCTIIARKNILEKEQYLKILAKNKHNISEVALQNECFDQVSSYINFQFNL